MNLEEIIRLLSLFNGLAPTAIALIRALAQSLQGKTDDEVLAAADALWVSVIAKANAELNPPKP